MPKKKGKGEYNDFLDGEKLRDNAEVRTSLAPSSSRKDVSPPPTRRVEKGRGKKDKNGPKQRQLTHFLCLPLVNEESRPQFEQALEGFREEVMKEGTVPVKAVRPLGTLHLTLGVMSLDREQVEDAERCLLELDLRSMLKKASPEMNKDDATNGNGIEAVTVHNPLSIDLEALVPMQQPHKTSILYAAPSDVTSRLYAFASALRDHFAEHGFLVEDKRPLKLHATIVNTVYAKPSRRDGKRNPSERQDKVESVKPSPTEDVPSGQDEQTTPMHPSIRKIEEPAQVEQDRSKGHGPHAKSWMQFDASQLIARHRNTLWAKDVSIDRVHICKMGAKKILDSEGQIVDEKYEVVAERAI